MVAVTPLEAPTFGEPIVATFIYADPIGGPVTQGSFDPTPHGGFRHAKKDDLDWWRERIETGIRRHRGPNAPCIETPVVVSLLFVAPRRASHAKYRIWPMGTEGDVDKLARAAVDGCGRNHRTETVGKGLNKKKIDYYVGAHVVSDDRKVIGLVSMKTYTRAEDDSGVQVMIWTLDPALERQGWYPVPDWPGWKYVHRDQLPCV